MINDVIILTEIYWNMSEYTIFSDGEVETEIIKKKSNVNILNNYVGASKVKIKKQLPWIEKYRPSKVDDIYIDTSTKYKIKKMINEKTLPNILITGTPGTGKTSTIKSIAKEMYGKYYNDGVLELNASDDRDVKSADEIIASFCKKKYRVNDNDMYDSSGNLMYPKEKLLILDEADNMTEKAQNYINKNMTEYLSTTKFAFTCNDSTQISRGIQSQCMIMRFRSLSLQDVIAKLEKICISEKIKYDHDGLYEIALYSEGDMRHAINTLQNVYNGEGYIDKKTVMCISDKPQLSMLCEILTEAKKKNIKKTFQLMDNLKKTGYSESDIITGFMQLIEYSHTFPEMNIFSEDEKFKIGNYVCETSFIISNGIDSKIQLFGMISSILKIYV